MTPFALALSKVAEIRERAAYRPVAGSTPAPSSIYDSIVHMRVPHDVELHGRRIHLSPGTRHRDNAAEPIWIASHDGRRASAETPDEAARMVL